VKSDDPDVTDKKAQWEKLKLDKSAPAGVAETI